MKKLLLVLLLHVELLLGLQFTHDMKLHDNYQMSWLFDETHITVKVVVKTKGIGNSELQSGYSWHKAHFRYVFCRSEGFIDWRNSPRKLKLVSKVSRHFPFFVNICPNFNAVNDFSLLRTLTDIRIFSAKKKLEMHYSSIEKWRCKIFRFQIGSFLGQKSTWSESPVLSQFKNVYGIALWHFKRL